MTKTAAATSEVSVDRVPSDLEGGAGGYGGHGLQKRSDAAGPGNCSNSDSGSNSGSSMETSDPLRLHHRKWIFGVLILLVGTSAAAAFWGFGIDAARHEQALLFEQAADDFASAVENAWLDYEIFGLWIHESCRAPPNASTDARLGICTREEFRELYEYIQSVGLDFQSAQFMPNVTHAQRPAVEADARQYYADNYPAINYRGITALFPDPVNGGITVQPQVEQDYYFPVHYMEPVIGNEAAIDLDLMSSATQRPTIQHALSNWQPALTDRLRLVQETQPHAYSIILHHPGIPLQEREQVRGRDRPDGISLMVIRVPSLIERAAQKQATDSKDIYIYDSTDQSKLPVFLGAAALNIRGSDEMLLAILPEVELLDIFKPKERMYSERTVHVADRTWTLAIQSVEGTYQPEVMYIALGGSIIFFASIILSVWFCSHMNRIVKINRIKSQAEREKSQIIVETARRQTVAERQLNEYLAHEVRNPLSSAITALSFVSATVQDTEIADGEVKTSLADDIGIIDASLQFINELLRNMLDMHRAADKHMTINMAPTDLLHDVLEPVAAILYLRGSKMQVLVECPAGLTVATDRLRLKQIVLNLATNASKFVIQGFIRLRACVVDGLVQVSVEDSGPGMPPEKQEQLFVKFQESLDLLNQGTGIGLCLCKHLSQLMHGDIWLDAEYFSGIEGHPGSRFVVDLRTAPIDFDQMSLEQDEPLPQSTDEMTDVATNAIATTDEAGAATVTVPVVPQHSNDETTLTKSVDGVPRPQDEELPKTLSVLFVDDDMILRKLFKRSLRRVAKEWEIDEAANGETALHMAESKQFDLIFLDQYMAAIEKQLLGSETARALRARGVTSTICGLSANDAESLFLEAGADAFVFKPFPCEPNALKQELLRILQRPPGDSTGTTRAESDTSDGSR